MTKKLNFRLNETDYSGLFQDETPVLDFIRQTVGLKGTKEGCREGDCGACLVLLGEKNKEYGLCWKAVTSCTLALGELDGKHLITIEGLAKNGLTPVMEAFLDEGASQCGFCSPGFILALTGFLVSGPIIDPVEAMIEVEGNLCRCTGYGSIRRAAIRLSKEFADLPTSIEERLPILAKRKVIPETLESLMLNPPEPALDSVSVNGKVLGGGTDFYVRNPNPDKMESFYVDRIHDGNKIQKVNIDGVPYVSIGAAVSASKFFNSQIIKEAVPGIEKFETRFASPLIRNRATLAGNIANASPIGDLSVILLALRAELVIAKISDVVSGIAQENKRTVKLEDFFISYKKTDIKDDEIIIEIKFPAIWNTFDFQKVAKRRLLDIASVNMAVAISKDKDGKATKASWSCGGVAEIPLRVKKAEELLVGKKPDASLVIQLGKILSETGNPLSDIRGSSKYRKNLLERLSWAACIRLWPELSLTEEIMK